MTITGAWCCFGGLGDFGRFAGFWAAGLTLAWADGASACGVSGLGGAAGGWGAGTGRGLAAAGCGAFLMDIWVEKFASFL